MELTVVRGHATPEELEAVRAALLQRLPAPTPPPWSDPTPQLRRPLRPAASPDAWRLSAWTT
ncbi:MAG TPA: acyl-CoA carboxylase subunit epsilon [Nonomuraea sp.]|nr:acyl-CoA carboxylase subunit epsilon [Nonomuraea sp.]